MLFLSLYNIPISSILRISNCIFCWRSDKKLFWQECWTATQHTSWTLGPWGGCVICKHKEYLVEIIEHGMPEFTCYSRAELPVLIMLSRSHTSSSTWKSSGKALLLGSRTKFQAKCLPENLRISLNTKHCQLLLSMKHVSPIWKRLGC